MEAWPQSWKELAIHSEHGLIKLLVKGIGTLFGSLYPSTHTAHVVAESGRVDRPWLDRQSEMLIRVSPQPDRELDP